VNYLADRLFAKIIAGENNLNGIVENVFIGSVSANAVCKEPLFQTKNKIVITSGDRSDMIIAALDSQSTAIVLTNNILPPSNAYLQKLPICHFDRREKSYSMIIKISQSLRSFEMTRLILQVSTNIIAKAEKMGIPLLLVSLDSYQTAKQIDDLEALPTKDDKEKIALIEKMISDHVDIKKLQLAK
jgi:BioD-like phosphotransacetylase family protein